MASTPTRSRRKAIFLDRDGTLIVDKHYLSDPAQVELLPGIGDALRAFVFSNYLLFLLTNQSGIARKLFTTDDLEACNRRMIELLALPDPGFTGICIAPEGPNDPVAYRKPSPRFILEMIARHNLDPAQSWIVGDKLSDVQTGLNAGIRTALLGPTLPVSIPEGVPHFTSLKEFASALLQFQ